MAKKPVPQFRNGWTTADGKVKKGFWQVRIDGSYRPLLDPNGEKLNDLKARDDAITARDNLLDKLANEQAEETDPTVKTILGRYLADLAKRVKKNEASADSLEKATEFAFDFITGYRASLKGVKKGGVPNKGKLVHKGYGDLRVSQLRKADVADWINAHKGWNSPKRPFGVLNAAFNLALSEDLISHNPLSGYRLPKANNRDQVWTQGEIDLVRQHATPSFRKLFNALLATGARPGELAVVRPSHLHREGGFAFWRLSHIEHKTGRKTGDKRYIQLTPELECMTMDAIARGDNGFLFTTAQGHQWQKDVWGTAFRRLAIKLTTLYPTFRRSLHLYDLRATFLTLGIERGVELKHLAMSAGTSVAMIERTYARWTTNTARLIGEAATKARSDHDLKIADVG